MVGITRIKLTGLQTEPILAQYDPKVRGRGWSLNPAFDLPAFLGSTPDLTPKPPQSCSDPYLPLLQGARPWATDADKPLILMSHKMNWNLF